MAAGDYYTHAGKASTAGKFDASDSLTFNRIGWGTGAGGAASSTALASEGAETRATATLSRVTTTQTNDTFQAVGTITATGANKTITEVGLFSAATSGTMLLVSEFTGVPVVAGDAIAFTLKLKFS